MRELNIGFLVALITISLVSAPQSGMAAAQTGQEKKTEATGTETETGKAATGARITGSQQADVIENMADLQKRLNDSTNIIQTMTPRGEDKIPPEIIENSGGIAIFPDVTKVALGTVGGRYGGGVLLLHRDNEWSGPIFISLYGASVGAQLGVEQSDLIMVFNKKTSLEKFSDGELQLGAEVSVAAGPWGEKAGTSPQAEVLAYKQTEGIFAGIALSGAILNTGEENNRMYYSEAKGTYPGTEKVLSGQEKLPKTEQTAALIEALNKYTRHK